MTKAGEAGRRAESAVVDALLRAGFRYAERRRLTGTIDRGDITGLPGVVIEVKGSNGGASSRIRLGEWLDETEREIANDKADTGVLVVKRPGKGKPEDWFAIMRLDRWLALLKEAGR